MQISSNNGFCLFALSLAHEQVRRLNWPGANYATPNVTKYQVPFLMIKVMRCLHEAWRVHQVACVFHQAVCYLHQLLRVCCHLLCFTH